MFKANVFTSAFLFFVAAAGSAPAQNQTPLLNNVSVGPGPNASSLTVSYDVDDPEEDKLQISLLVSRDGGQTYVPVTQGLAGDVGPSVAKGAGKKITWQYAQPAPKPGACLIKLVADDLYRVDIDELVSQVDSMNLKSTIARIYGNRYYKRKKGAAHKEEVKETIHNSFTACNLKTERQDFTYAGYKAQNIIGEKTGADPAAKVYIICAHFDTTKKSPGGDDNSSGVVGVLEAARILSKYNFKHSIKFVGFDLEEENLIGSGEFVRQAGIKKTDSLAGVINFDMIGTYSDRPRTQLIPEGFEVLFPEATQQVAQDQYRGNFAVNTTNERSKPLAEAFSQSAQQYVPSLKVISLVTFNNGEMTPNLAASDHYPFWKGGYKALHIGDGGETRNPYLDTSKDTLDKLNFTFMSNVVKATIATIAGLAGMDHSTAQTVSAEL